VAPRGRFPVLGHGQVAPAVLEVPLETWVTATPTERMGIFFVFGEYLENHTAKKFQTRVVCRPRGALSNGATPVPEGLGVRELRPVKGAAFSAYISRTPRSIFPKLESIVVLDGAFRMSPPPRSNSPGSPSYGRSKSVVPANGESVGGVPAARHRPGSSKGPRGTSSPEFELSGSSGCRDTGVFLPRS
jgi:hypothetical protein